MIQATFRTRPTRILGFDLENRPSAYWYGDKTTAEITAIAWKWVGDKRMWSLLLLPDGAFRDDYGVLLSVEDAYMRFRKVLCSSDVVFGHNIRQHDLGLFQSGLLRLQLPPLPPLRTSDTLRDYPKKKDMAASLDAFATMYRLGRSKKHMTAPAWEQANKLLPDGILDTYRRVTGDVLLQERLRAKLLKLGLLGEPRVWQPRRDRVAA